MKNILVITDNNPNTAARPNRLLKLLSELDYNTYVLSSTPFNNDKIKHFKLNKKMTNWEGFIYILNLYKIFNKFLNLNPMSKNELNKINNIKYDLIICENLTVIYYAFLFKSEKTKIMLDLREFYTMQFSKEYHTKIFKKIYYNSKIKYLDYLLKEYASKSDKLITVSPGLQKKYNDVYGYKCELIMSLPEISEKKSEIKNSGKIRLVHHGGAKESRKIELMIQLMDKLDENKYELDLYLIKYHQNYYDYLKELIKNKKNIKIFPEINQNEIANTLVNYDIGLILFEATTFNIEYSLPNKLFEFIQSGLCVVAYPLPNIKSIVDEYEVGIISKDYNIDEIANKLNNLTYEELNEYKLNSQKASKELNIEKNNKKLTEIINKLIE